MYTGSWVSEQRNVDPGDPLPRAHCNPERFPSLSAPGSLLLESLTLVPQGQGESCKKPRFTGTVTAGMEESKGQGGWGKMN